MIYNKLSLKYLFLKPVKVTSLPDLMHVREKKSKIYKKNSYQALKALLSLAQIFVIFLTKLSSLQSGDNLQLCLFSTNHFPFQY